MTDSQRKEAAFLLKKTAELVRSMANKPMTKKASLSAKPSGYVVDLGKLEAAFNGK